MPLPARVCLPFCISGHSCSITTRVYSAIPPHPTAEWLREPLQVAEEVEGLASLLGRDVLHMSEVLPRSHRDHGQQHGVDHPHGRDVEADHVLRLSPVLVHPAPGQQHRPVRENEDGPNDQEGHLPEFQIVQPEDEHERALLIDERTKKFILMYGASFPSAPQGFPRFFRSLTGNHPPGWRQDGSLAVLRGRPRGRKVACRPSRSAVCNRHPSQRWSTGHWRGSERGRPARWLPLGGKRGTERLLKSSDPSVLLT